MNTEIAKDELSRIVRHTLTPLAVLAVSRGWIPAELQSDIVDIAVPVVALVISLLLSNTSARKRSSSQ